MAPINFDVDRNLRPVLATLYTRCSQCNTVATPSAARYHVTGPHGGIDLARTIRITCTSGRHTYRVTVSGVLPRDSTATCQRPPDSLHPYGCASEFRIPTNAYEIVCPACRLIQNGGAALSHADVSADDALDLARVVAPPRRGCWTHPSTRSAASITELAPGAQRRNDSR